MIISNYAIKNRVAVGVLMVLIACVGVYSYVTLSREAFPDVNIPMVVVTTVREGVAPADMESTVTMKIEKQLSGISGIKEVRSSSAEGLSLITVEFLPEMKIDDALQRVRDKVSQARSDLPTDIKTDPIVTEISFSDFPIMMINMSGPVSPVSMKYIADELKDVIEVIPGVMSCSIMGALEREVRLELDPNRVAAFGLTIPEVMTLVPSENVNISAGSVETQGTKFNVRTPAEFKTPEEAIHIPLTSRAGKIIYLDDVANVTDTFKDRVSFSRVNGKESLTLSVQKRIGGNIIDITDRVNAVLAEAQKRVPAGVTFDVTHDMSKEIRRMVADLENHIMSGLVLVMAVLLLFLGWRASLIVAIAIPLSLMISFAVLQWMGYSLNMIVLFSLIMVLGMLVDDAIVIVENVYRHMQLGYSNLDAAVKGTAEVAWPVITSTATKVAAFAPMIFWPGMMGSFMKYLPITLVVTLSSSLLVALVINPTICAAFGGRVPKREKESLLLGAYRRMLEVVMRYRAATLVLVLAVLVSLALVYGKFGRGMEFFPEADPSVAIVNIRCPQGTNVNQSDALARIVEQRASVYKQHMKYVVSNVGGDDSMALFSGGTAGPHIANLSLMFNDYEVRTKSSTEIVKELRDSLSDITGAEVKVEKQKDGPPSGAAVTVRVIGKDFDTLQETSEKAKKAIAGVPNLVNLRSDYEASRPELTFITDRQKAAMLGLSTSLIGNYLRTELWGSKVGTYREFNDEFDITVRLPENRRQLIDDLLNGTVQNPTGRPVPLTSLGQLTYSGGKGTINRINQKRVISLTADVEGRTGPEVLADVQEILSPLGRATLLPGDILDWPALVKELKNPTTAVGKKLVELLDKQTKTSLPADANTLDEKRRGHIAFAINQVLVTWDFYQPEEVKKLSLPDDLKPLAAKERKPGPHWIKIALGLAKPDPTALDSTDVHKLNRLVLEAAYPGMLESAPQLAMPPGYEVRYAGEKEEQDKATAFLGKAFIVALLLILLVLVAEFNTLSVPLVIMSTVLLSLIGVLLGLLIHAMPFGVIMTGVGVISLTGVVVANGIVLLDFTRKLQRRGLDVVRAAVQASATRLRPVFLTAITAILGLLPMATGLSFDFHTLHWATKSETSQFWAAMAIAVIYGLAFATVLTLVVVPVLYVSIYRLLERFGLGGLQKMEVDAKPAAELEDF